MKTEFELLKSDGMRMPVSFISLRFERVDNLGAYRIPPETGILMEGVSAQNPSKGQ